jgi:pimeloyl-ACP methyl ester carboxylesterase
VTSTTTIRHSRVDLALHQLRDAEGPALLLLHGLGERSPAAVPPVAEAWPGPVHALDFTGHGDSTVPSGGGYTCEVLMADADAVLAHLGPATVLGRGLGAYVALLLAGARPSDVRGAVLVDGPGLFGGPSAPASPSIVQLAPARERTAPDPYALVELTRDVRPPDYAASFAAQASHLSGLENPVSVAAIGRPPWLEAVVEVIGVRVTTAAQALADHAEVAAGLLGQRA